jgi:hypothetical protein
MLILTPYCATSVEREREREREICFKVRSQELLEQNDEVWNTKDKMKEEALDVYYVFRC